MGFTTTERINLFTKALAAGVIDANSIAAWYETFFPFQFILDGSVIWTDLSTVKANPAANLATAQANAAGPLSGIVDDLSAPASAVRLTLVSGTNNSTYAAYSVYNDPSSTLLDNWLLPQLVPQSSGSPSNGYAIQLYDGDPNGSGTLISTTEGTTGTGVNKTVGWIFNYASGLLFLSDDFKSSVSDPYILGFRYIGSTATAPAGGSDPDAIHDNIAGEIASITGKTDPVGADIFIIEDSEDSNNKKSLVFSDSKKEIIDTRTTSYTILFSDNGKTFINTGASSLVQLTLPTASSGLRYSFIVSGYQRWEYSNGCP
jgi:hypothetical protein